MRVLNQFLETFPPPAFLSMPAVGIDISDYSIKFIEFVHGKHGLRVGRFGAKKIPAGIVASGRIQKHDALVTILSELREEHGLRFVRASLPEERGYLFDTHVPADLSPNEIRGALEFSVEEHVPIPPEQAIFDYDVVRTVGGDKHKRTVVVSVFPREEVEMYTSLFTRAGLTPLSLEIEAQALARAVVPNNDVRTHIIVDFGKQRSGISIASGGVTRFAVTVDIGGDAITDAISAAYPDAKPEEVDEMKNTQGLGGFHDNKELRTTIHTIVDSLTKEIDKHRVFWQTHELGKQNNTEAARIILCGGNANLAGFSEYVSRALSVPVARANVWTNVLDIEKQIPPIHFRYSLGYAPAIGLALHES